MAATVADAVGNDRVVHVGLVARSHRKIEAATRQYGPWPRPLVVAKRTRVIRAARDHDRTPQPDRVGSHMQTLCMCCRPTQVRCATRRRLHRHFTYSLLLANPVLV